MKLQTGKHYRTKKGFAVLITEHHPNDKNYPFIGYMVTGDTQVGVPGKWKANGKYWLSERDSSWDLIEEIADRKTLAEVLRDTPLNHMVVHEVGMDMGPAVEKSVRRDPHKFPPL